jgi:hypothetical protein
MKTSTPGGAPFKKAGAWFIAVLLALGLPLPAFAALGDVSNSVQTDQAQMRAGLKVIEEDAYTIHEMKSPNGTVVREYVSRADGRVFGITWQGPFIPDLKQLLGAYFQQYSRAAQVQRETQVGRHPLNIHEPGLVVQTAGHMRAFSGRAYDPGLIPAGVSDHDIQ